MKCTLRKVPQGVVATIDERPKKGNTHYYDTSINELFLNDLDEYDKHDKWNWSVIASTFGVGKELRVNYMKRLRDILNGSKYEVDLTKEYDYTETETQIIIQL